MIVKAAEESKNIKIGPDLISIDIVKGNKNLIRIAINKVFVGYLQLIDGKYHRLDGSKIHDLTFAKICQNLEAPCT
jgi:hypothetical protein